MPFRAEGHPDLKWCILNQPIEVLGGSNSPLGKGDKAGSNPDKIQLAFVDLDHGTNHPGATWDKEPWSASLIESAVKV